MVWHQYGLGGGGGLFVGVMSMRAFRNAVICPHAHRIMQQVVSLPL
ncbi:MAG TPA: hypothetical protein PK702_09090 [Burkholderiaceae bacterium]|nr:hypothetical protein [Burkholderiaceae bacterium]